MDKTFNEIVIASWLHSIGLFAKKAENENSINVYECSKKILTSIKDCFPQNLNIDNIFQWYLPHSTPNTFEEWLIAHGDSLSRGVETCPYNDESTISPLVNILSTLKLSEKPQPKPSTVNLNILEKDAVLSKSTEDLTPKMYQLYIDRFVNDFKNLKGLDGEEFLASFVSLLEHYWWCIPLSDTDNDISLFQHAKTTAAFVGALYRYHVETGTATIDHIKDYESKKFLLVNGDMSGIQKYIFDLKIPKHNAKLLRARSFQLWALSEIISGYIIQEFGLSNANIITAAGGKFLILLHNTNTSKDMLQKLQLKFENYFLKEFAGKLFFILSDGVEASSLDMKKENIPSFINKVGYKAEECKQRKMQRALNDKGHVFDTLYAGLQQYGECSFCNVFPVSKEEEKICEHCSSLKEIGERLVKANKIIFEFEKLREDRPFGDLIKIRLKETKEFGFVINEFQAGFPCINLPYVAPNENNSIKTFEDIVKDSSGIHKLAMFKADIDNLGLVFTSSLGNRMSLSRYADISRILHYFFSAYYAYFVDSNPKYKNKIYTVFSGGDDLCVLGPWNIIMDFAYDFRQELQKLTNDNPSITLSAGISMASSSLPVRNMAEMSEDQLEMSKSFKENGKLKNAVTVFGTSISWGDFDKYITEGKKLSEFMKNQRLATGPVYKLIDFSNRAKNALNGTMRDMVWMSNFRYMVARNINTSKDKNKDRDIEDAFIQFGTAETMKKAIVSASYALYANRKNTQTGGE
ncbi:type III-A CRISPR-associated protein Cas10/Csm1 [Treponema sp. OMZ 787]|uniref:type III-A CRISPR-associated protein Cas10/Csm1 n=1 Tax=Treponema sp. OMZ 787 TaxID=2563669 RepID=UPI0020A277E2|nr:type III-A CRISPR-associated protein Cas10/Csm1 [Treponema sp. OMZ 787]UTC61724.1 type III-A CRISPR-associated protein Cas10/Csm1 [Treponema sp. OMZ 787]